ncbi:tRNA delta(2)-isopentenylpyrophosphate transferase, partial [Mycobacterium avium 09-5983]
ALRRLPGQILGRVAFGVLAGLAEPGPRSAKELYRGALRGGLLRRRLAAVTAAVRPLAIIGPTGTGKSQLALDVAERLGPLGAEIVNADAMQLYRGMDIGTAKLPVDARRGIPHHQLDVLDVTQTATVARYQRAAAADIEAILAAGAVPIIVGGSMLYIQSLLDDWSFPATDPRVRARWERRLAEVGVGELHAEL